MDTFNAANLNYQGFQRGLSPLAASGEIIYHKREALQIQPIKSLSAKK